jgi:hypothetical protein
LSHPSRPTFAVWFHTEKNKLLWNTPIKQLTTGAASSITTPKYDLVVHDVGAKEPDIPFYLDDAKVADISDDDSVSVVIRPGDGCHYYQVFNLKTGQASTSGAKLGRAFTGFLSPNLKSLASAMNSRLSR